MGSERSVNRLFLGSRGQLRHLGSIAGHRPRRSADVVTRAGLAAILVARRKLAGLPVRARGRRIVSCAVDRRGRTKAHRFRLPAAMVATAAAHPLLQLERRTREAVRRWHRRTTAASRARRFSQRFRLVPRSVASRRDTHFSMGNTSTARRFVLDGSTRWRTSRPVGRSTRRSRAA